MFLNSSPPSATLPIKFHSRAIGSLFSYHNKNLKRLSRGHDLPFRWGLTYEKTQNPARQYICHSKSYVSPILNYIYLYIYKYTYIYLYIYKYTYIYIYIYMYACIYIYIYIYIYTHTHTHAYIYIYIYMKYINIYIWNRPLFTPNVYACVYIYIYTHIWDGQLIWFKISQTKWNKSGLFGKHVLWNRPQNNNTKNIYPSSHEMLSSTTAFSCRHNYFEYQISIL